MKAKKSLGQNFLKSEIALRKIVEAGEIKKNDIVLEIGPGKGALTKKLLATSCQVLAVEKDRDLYEMLKIKFQKEISSGQFNLIYGDILEFDTRTYNLEASTYKIIANIPYNITGAILKKFLTADDQPELMVLMVQNEVAKRIIARPTKGRAGGSESILSISVKAYGEPKMIIKVPARYFSPAPKVDSAVIAITNISRKTFTSPRPSPTPPDLPLSGEANGFPLIRGNTRGFKGEGEINEEKFWQIVKAGFAHKRKKLAGNLTGVVSVEKLIQLQDKRAENLTLKDWIELVED